MISTSCFKDDEGYSVANPPQQCAATFTVTLELCVSAVVRPMRIQRLFGDVYPNVLLQSSFPPLLVIQAPAKNRGLSIRVRRQGFWDQWRPKLRESLAHLIGLIMRRICGEASAALRVFFV